MLDLSTKYKRNSSGDDKEGEKEGGEGAMGHQKGFYLQNIFNNINAYLPKGSPSPKKHHFLGIAKRGGGGVISPSDKS